MTREQLIKVLKSRNATKEQLRAALAASLGVEYEAPRKEKKETLFTGCRDYFLEAYHGFTNLHYSFGTKDGVALSQIIKKITAMFTHGATDENVLLTFKALINKLPDWYKQNAFSLPKINSSFNEITAKIKNSNGQQQGISDDYIARVLREAIS